MTKEYEHCLRCGRKLKNPEARLKGFGLVCEKKMQSERFKKYRLLSNKWTVKPTNCRECKWYIKGTGGK